MWKLLFKKCCWKTCFLVFIKKKCVWYHSLNNVFQCSKNIKNVFGTCVYFCKKSWTYVRIFFFLNLDRELPVYPFVAHISSSLTYIPSIPSAENQTPALLISIDTSEHPWLSFTFVGSHLHRQHSKIQPEIELLSPPTHHSKIQVRISLSPCLSMGFGAKSEEFLLHSDVCCLVFVFCFFLFFLTNRENPFFLFFVCCWDNIWFTIHMTSTPYILEI